MDIIESAFGKLNLNIGNMNNPNIIIEGIKIDNSDDSNDSDEEGEGDESEDDNEEEEEEEEEDDDDDDEEEINDNNNQINNLINDESNEDNYDEDNYDENSEEEENEEEENEEEENNDLHIFKLKKDKFILNLNEFQYKHIKKYTKNKEKKCPICLLKYKGPDIIKEFPCNHIYHKNCILKWLKISNICPLCKYDITNEVNNIKLSKISDDKSNNDDEEDEKEKEEIEDD